MVKRQVLSSFCHILWIYWFRKFWHSLQRWPCSWTFWQSGSSLIPQDIFHQDDLGLEFKRGHLVWTSSPSSPVLLPISKIINHFSRLKENAKRLVNELELGQWILDKGLDLNKRYSKVGVPSNSLLKSKLVLVQLYQVSWSVSLFEILSSKFNIGTRSSEMNMAPDTRPFGDPTGLSSQIKLA